MTEKIIQTQEKKNNITLMAKCHNCNNSFIENTMKTFNDYFYCNDCYNELRECVSCSELFSEDEIIYWNDNTFCEDCLNNTTSFCDDCGERVNNSNIAEINLNHICNDCFDNNYFNCDNCGEYVHNDDYGDEGCCYRCENDNRDNSEFEEIKIRNTFEKSKTFKINKFKNFCGVEIEVIGGNMFSYDELKNFQFSQIPDGSVSNGGEFVSCAMNGDNLFNKIDNFCKELDINNFKINTDWGMHIHIKVNKNIENLKKIYIFYKKYEDYFFNMLPKSRQQNNYCFKLKNKLNLCENDVLKYKNSYDFQKNIYNSTNKYALSRFKKNKYNDKRYSWLNFHSVFYRGTLEIRNHQGTINPTKIKNWLKIHLTIINLLKNININMINNLPKDKTFFLSFFDENLKNYILERWAKFENEEIKNV